MLKEAYNSAEEDIEQDPDLNDSEEEESTKTGFAQKKAVILNIQYYRSHK